MKYLQSKDNATFKSLKSLLTRKGRKQSGQFLLEGARYIRSALEMGIRPEMLIFSEEIPEDAPSYGMMSMYGLASCSLRLSNALFAELSDTEHSQGVLAVFGLANLLTGAPTSPRGDVVVLDVVRDPGNVGTILRTADAAGISQVFLVEGCADPFSPKAMRSTAGSILHLRLTIAPRRQIIEMLRAQGYRIVASTLGDSQESRGFFRQCAGHGGTVPGGEKTPLALVLGNEAQGVSSGFLEAADARIHIPIYGRAESLNVAVAAGILIYQMQER
ncbi:MAG: RNA methyltransferase [Bacillota bacterium]|nr:RNA methyltransferase [Bacillota bacterium]